MGSYIDGDTFAIKKLTVADAPYKLPSNWFGSIVVLVRELGLDSAGSLKACFGWVW